MPEDDRPAPATQLARSQAFQQASLRSEVRRSYAVLCVLLLLVMVLARGAAFGILDDRIKLAAALAIGALLALHCGVIAFVHCAAPARGLPVWFISATVIVENSIPTGMLIYLIGSGALRPYAALSAPPLLTYSLILTLNALRLRPWVCILAGAVGAAGYGGILAYVTLVLGIHEPTTGLPWIAYFNIAMLILIGGIAAAWVAREIRHHVEAALGEAETRKRVALIERDLAAARTIQQALVPRAAPDIPGFEIVGWNRPAEETGGDYYDWQAMPDGNWLVTLADVSGHGIGPAMVTAACRAYVRASNSHHGDLGSLTTRINDLLPRDLPDGRFITMASALINPRRGSVALLSAGHSPVVLYIRATGSLQDIPPHDVPLAVLPDQRFGPAQVLAMQPGDLLALVTDGFVEWARHDEGGRREQFGVVRLHDALRRHAGRPLREAIDAITGEVAVFAGDERQQDDLTMVLILRRP